MKLRCAEQILVAAELQHITLRPLAERVAASKLFGQSPALPAMGAQPELRRCLQGPHPVRRDFHRLREPAWHGPRHQFFVREALRLRGVSFGKVHRTLDLSLQRLCRLKPAAPPEIGKYRRADPASLLRRQVAVGLEHLAENRVGRVLTIRRTDDLFCQPEEKGVHAGQSAELTPYDPPSNCRST